jgi:hypothetical protein
MVFPAGPFLALSGIALSGVLVEKIQCRALAYLGQITLGIYVTSALFQSFSVGDGAGRVIFATVFTLACSVATVSAISRIGILRALLLGKFDTRPIKY